jgi:hypothetical protein
MGIYSIRSVRHTAVCDHCGKQYRCVDTESRIPTKKILLECLKLDNWKRVNGKLWCPSTICQDKNERARQNRHVVARTKYFDKHKKLEGFYDD